MSHDRFGPLPAVLPSCRQEQLLHKMEDALEGVMRELRTLQNCVRSVMVVNPGSHTGDTLGEEVRNSGAEPKNAEGMSENEWLLLKVVSKSRSQMGSRWPENGNSFATRQTNAVLRRHANPPRRKKRGRPSEDGPATR